MRIWLVVVAVALVPAVAMAAQFRAGEDSVRVTDDVINDNLYVAGGDILVDSTVRGDAFVAGGQIEVSGQIGNDLFIGGGNIRVTGPVGEDIRIGGGSIRIENDVAGELMVGGGSVEIAEGAHVAGPVYVGAGQLTIAGTTGPVMAGTDSLRVTSTAQVNGDLQYTSANQAQVEEGATITGKTMRRIPPQPPEGKKIAGATLFGGSIIWLIVSLVMLLLYVYVLPNKAKAVSTDWRDTFWFNLLIGFVFLIVTPIAGVVLLISIIGIPLGIGVLLLYPIALYIGKLVGTVAAGTWLRSLLDKKASGKVDWISAVIGFLGLSLIALVPALGGLVVFVVFLVGLGALVRYDWKLLQDLRGGKKI